MHCFITESSRHTFIFFTFQGHNTKKNDQQQFYKKSDFIVT